MFGVFRSCWRFLYTGFLIYFPLCLSTFFPFFFFLCESPLRTSYTEPGIGWPLGRAVDGLYFYQEGVVVGGENYQGVLDSER